MHENQWWLEEQPQTVATPRNVVRWFPKAGKLQVSRPDRDGMVGKTVTLDIGAACWSGQGKALQTLLADVSRQLAAACGESSCG